MKVKILLICCTLFLIIYFAIAAGIFIDLEPRHAVCKVGKEVKYTLTIQTQNPTCFFLDITGINSSWVKDLPNRVCVEDTKTIRFSLIPSKEGSYSFNLIASSYNSRNIVRATLNVLKSNSPPTSIAVTPDKFAPQPPGSTIKWTASSYDPDGDVLYYRFWLKKPGESEEKVVRDWNTSNVWTWNTAGLPEGTYVVYVDVKDGKHNEVDRFVAFKYILLSS